MEKYRIRKETRKNGQVWFYPECKSSFFKGWQSVDDKGELSHLGHYSLNSIEGARACISIRKNALTKKDGANISSTEFIYDL